MFFVFLFKKSGKNKHLNPAPIIEQKGVILFLLLMHILYICAMIQRRQSIYLLLATLIAALLLILDLTYFNTEGVVKNGETVSLEIGYVTTVMPDEKPLRNTSLIGGLAAYALLSFVTIFLYKNRRRQIMACTLGYAFLMFSAVMMYKYSYGNNYFDETISESLEWTAIIPLALFIFQFLALQGIKRDEALVKSHDRIR